jgi:hypothetical protein
MEEELLKKKYVNNRRCEQRRNFVTNVVVAILASRVREYMGQCYSTRINSINFVED